VERRAFIVGGIAAFAAPLAAEAQPVGKIPRVGYLAGQHSTDFTRGPEAFRQGLRDLGWVVDQNIVIEGRSAAGRYHRLPELATELVRLKVDVIVAMGNAASTAAKNATGTIPIIGVSMGDPVAQGLVASLARPGGNITGLTNSAGSGSYQKGLELLKEAAPKVRRVAVLSNPANPGMSNTLQELHETGRSLGVELQPLQARGPDQFDAAYGAMAQARAGALLLVTEAMFAGYRARLVDLAARHKLPTMYGERQYVEAGGFMSYGTSLNAMVRRSAFYVDKVLKGAKPADLPVEQPATFELMINLKTAKALGLTIPPAVLARADEVIQ
jgi:putative ABC transport system substrate-binding protein